MTKEKKPGAFRAYLTKKGVTLSPRLYFVDAMSAMALGLFASLLMSTIFSTIAGNLPTDAWMREYLTTIADFAKKATGAVMGIAIANALKASPLVLLSAGVVGLCGNDLGTVIEGVINPTTGKPLSVAAGPLGTFICVLLAVEIGKLVSKATKVDILVTPAVTLGVGTLTAMLTCPGVAYLMYYLGEFINITAQKHPLVMGIIISVVVGIVLTLPISSAALCAMISISGLAGGAAVAGCCAQMIGFAVISFRENKWGGLVAQGIGTSMLQMGNIVKNPIIWLPPTLAAAITGPIATCLFKLECTGVSAGMGTCGFVGPIGVFTDMGFTLNSVIGVILVCFVLPALLSLGFDFIFRRLGWIKSGDMKLDL